MKIARIIAGLSVSLSSVVLGGCSKVHEVKIKSVTFDRDVSSIFYAKGDSFDHKYGSVTNIPNLVLKYENEVSKTIFYGDEKLAYSTFSPDTLGEQTINVTYKSNEQQVSTSYKVTVVKGIAPEFVEQPVDQETVYPKGSDDGFNVKVKYEDEATYQWESNTISKTATDWYPIDTTTGRSSHLEVPVTDANTTYYRCKVTSTITGLYAYSEPVALTITNSDQFVNCLYVGEKYILNDGTLDLSKETPYGSGTISLKKTTETEGGKSINVDTVTFDNVEFNVCEPKGADTNFFGISFMANYICKRKESSKTNDDVWEYEVDEYRFKFKGENRIINEMWDEDYNSGGYTFYFDFFNYPIQQPTDPVIVRPLVKFLRNDTTSYSDSLYCYGGTNAIYADCRFELDVPTTLESEPNRFSRGITANQFTLKKECSIFAPCLGGSVISTEYSPDYSYPNMGDILIEENASIKARIHPGAVKNAPTEVYGIKAAMHMETKKGSNIDIKIIVDMNLFDGVDSRVISPFAGIHIAYQNGLLRIYESNIKIEFSAENEEDSKRGNVSNVNGIAAPNLHILGSTVNIDINSVDFTEVTGILGQVIEILNAEDDQISSNIDINVFGSYAISGIRIMLINVDDKGVPDKTSFVFHNSDLRIKNASKYSITKGKNVGLVLYSPTTTSSAASKVVFDFDDSKDHIVDIDLSGVPGKYPMPIVYVTELNVMDPRPDPSYAEEFTSTFENAMVDKTSSAGYCINLDIYEHNAAEIFYGDSQFKTRVPHVTIKNTTEY